MKAYSDIPNLTDRVTRKTLEGKSYNICREIYTNTQGSARTLIESNSTKVRIVTRVACWTQAAIDTSPSGQTASSVHTLIKLCEPAGTARETLPILSPSHWMGSFTSPNLAQQSNNDRTLVWEPIHPIVVPEGWSLTAEMDATRSGSAIAPGDRQSVSLWLQVIDLEVNEARALGYPCNPDTGASSSTVGRRWIQTGSQLPTSSVTLVTGHGSSTTGDFIRIDDIVVRMNPNTVAATGEWIELRESDDSVIFRWFRSAKTGEPLEKIIRGPIYTKTRGNGLKIVSSSNVYNTSTASVIVIGEFVTSKPDNAWYAYKNPTISSPLYSGSGTANVVASTVKTAPGLGLRLVVEGVDFSGGSAEVMQANGGVIATLSSGSSANTSVIAPSSNNIVLLPTWAMASKMQQTNFTIDRVNMPTKENTSIYFENQSPLYTPNVQSVVDWAVTVWGYTEPTNPNAAVTTKYKGI